MLEAERIVAEVTNDEARRRAGGGGTSTATGSPPSPDRAGTVRRFLVLATWVRAARADGNVPPNRGTQRDPWARVSQLRRLPMVPIRRRVRWWPRALALAVATVAAASLLAACGGGSGPPTLTWYINPDPNPPAGFSGAFGQAGIAKAVQHRPLHGPHRAAAAERHRAAHPAAAPAGGEGLVDLPDEPRPGLHRRVRGSGLPRAAAEGPRVVALEGDAQGRRQGRDLGQRGWSRPPCGPTPRCCGSASPWRRRPAST